MCCFHCVGPEGLQTLIARPPLLRNGAFDAHVATHIYMCLEAFSGGLSFTRGITANLNVPEESAQS